jgi:hypothetical protein
LLSSVTRAVDPFGNIAPSSLPALGYPQSAVLNNLHRRCRREIGGCSPSSDNDASSI